jgi:acetylornithine/succinyldiaminopimelate/putrescine aminotransferase
MNPAVEELELAEPYLAERLSSFGLAVEYIRAEGNTLYYRGDNGREIPVLDLVGGFGSAILGHNNPEIVAYAKSLLDERTPTCAQFSLHPYANDVARKINTIIQRELGDSEPYFAIFANSGAEAIEVAIKYAELDRVMKLAAIERDIDANIEKARAAVRDGTAVVSDSAFDVVGASERALDGSGFDGLVAAIRSINSARMDTPPIFLALEGSFHGKLVGSVQLTHNVSFRTPFTLLAAQCRFVPVNRPEALVEVIHGEQLSLFDVMIDNGVVRVVTRDMPIFCAFVLEPIQGEGGIKVLGGEFAQQVQRACAAIDCPIIIDEIQSGMGRSGAFLASSLIGLRGDYYTLAKSLGGGIAKAAIMLIHRSRYRREFELMHSSTFAKDSFSTLIASKTLDLLEADNGKAYRLAEERGNRLLAMLRAIRDDFGAVVKEVRGKGLMIGLEFHDQSDSTSEIIREHARAGMLAYVAAGYLLRTHSIRIFPTASAVNTLRLEPSVYLTDAEIDHADSGLRGLCTVLRDQDGESLLGTLRGVVGHRQFE